MCHNPTLAHHHPYRACLQCNLRAYYIIRNGNVNSVPLNLSVPTWDALFKSHSKPVGRSSQRSTYPRSQPQTNPSNAYGISSDTGCSGAGGGHRYAPAGHPVARPLQNYPDHFAVYKIISINTLPKKRTATITLWQFSLALDDLRWYPCAAGPLPPRVPCWKGLKIWEICTEDGDMQAIF